MNNGKNRIPKNNFKIYEIQLKKSFQTIKYYKSSFLITL